MAFRKHAKAIIKKTLSCRLFFLRPTSLLGLQYQHLFDSTEWPEYKVNRQTGKIFTLHETFKPDTVKNLRTCFRFIHEPADPTPS